MIKIMCIRRWLNSVSLWEYLKQSILLLVCAGSCIPTLQHRPLGCDSTKCCLYSDPYWQIFYHKPSLFLFIPQTGESIFTTKSLCNYNDCKIVWRKHFYNVLYYLYLYSTTFIVAIQLIYGFAVTETGIKMYWWKDKLKPNV